MTDEALLSGFTFKGECSEWRSLSAEVDAMLLKIQQFKARLNRRGVALEELASEHSAIADTMMMGVQDAQVSHQGLVRNLLIPASTLSDIMTARAALLVDHIGEGLQDLERARELFRAFAEHLEESVLAKINPE